MSAIKSLSSPEVVERIQALEDQSDKCYENLELLKSRWNVATWASLVKAADQLEGFPREQFGDKRHQAMLLNLSRITPLMCDWWRKHGDRRTAPISQYRWTRSRERSTAAAFDVARQYFSFCVTFPAWHHDLVAGDLLDPDGVAFLTLDDVMGKRVSAYGKGMGPISDAGETLPLVARSPRMDDLIIEALRTVEAKRLEITYPKPIGLLEFLNDLYQDRLSQAFRRYEGTKVGGYSLKEFRMVSASLIAVASVHEHICYRWSLVAGKRYPLESSVLHHPRTVWIKLLCELSTLDSEIVSAIVDDLTLGATKLLDLMVHPFIALDDDNRRLGIVPHFVLGSNHEENILRTCSLIRPRVYDVASAQKEVEMREEISSLKSPYRITGPVDVRNDLPDIDLIVEDTVNSTVAICELKWGRKPYSVRERISRTQELNHGMKQLAMLQKFLGENPDFLRTRGRLTRRLDEYRLIEYLLVARDYITWIPPADGRAIVSFNPFKAILQEPNLFEGISRLLSYDWLPVENINFRIGLNDDVANKVRMRSEIFYSL